MDRIDTIAVPKSLPRPTAADDVQKVFAAIWTRPMSSVILAMWLRSVIWSDPVE